MNTFIAMVKTESASAVSWKGKFFFERLMLSLGGSEVDDVRTLPTHFDSHGSRWREFRNAVTDILGDSFNDFR